MTDGSEGLPDIWLDDRIFQAIKKARCDLLMEKERRLFYVAITRTQQEFYLLTERGNISRFIDYNTRSLHGTVSGQFKTGGGRNSIVFSLPQGN